MRLLRTFLIFAAILPLAVPAEGQESADRPSAMKLFPANTFVFVRSPNAREFIDKMKESSTGRMAADPAISPLLGDLYKSANELFEENVAEDAGLSLEEIRQLPQGEIAFGIVGRPAQTPAGLLLIDFGDQADRAKELLENLTEKAIEDGAEHAVETIAGEEVHVWGSGDEQLGIVQRGSVVLAANDRGVLERVLTTWDRAVGGGDSAEPAEPTLAENANFVAVIRECYREGEPPPQLVMFADPIGLIKEFVPGNAGLRIAVATFPALGIDGLLAIGGTMSVSTENWDSLMHVHILLDNPRAGVVRLFKFGPGNAEPPKYVPAGVASYTAIKVEPKVLFDEIAKLVDKFRYEGSVRAAVQGSFDESVGVKFEEELLPQLTGQIHLVSGFDPSLAPGGKFVVAVEVADAEGFRKLLDRMMEKAPPESTEKRTFGGVEYDAAVMGFDDLPENRRPMSPCMAMIGNTFVWSMSENMLQSFIEAEQGTKPRLADAIEYRLVSNQLAKLAKGQEPIWFAYRDNEVTLRHFYELALTDEARDFLTREQEDENANRFSEAFRNNELPSFDVLAKYIAPSGLVAYDTNTGFHFVIISFRRE